MGRFKKYYRRRLRKVRWCSNITNIGGSALTAYEGEFSNTATLITNPTQSSNTTSQIYTVKNVEVSFNLEATDVMRLNRLTIFIMFVPQGMNVSNDYHIIHPEYIMAMKYVGNPDLLTNSTTQLTPPGRNAVRVKSRLARNLNTGDSIILYINGNNMNTSSITYNIFGIIRWWTKAN